MSVMASGDQQRSSVNLRTALVLNTPTLLPTTCSSVCESRPNQQPYTNMVWLFCRCAPRRRAITSSPNGKTGCEYVLCLTFEYGVTLVSARM